MQKLYESFVIRGVENLGGPAAAVIRRRQALSGFTGHKEFTGGLISRRLNPDA